MPLYDPHVPVEQLLELDFRLLMVPMRGPPPPPPPDEGDDDDDAPPPLFPLPPNLYPPELVAEPLTTGV